MPTSQATWKVNTASITQLSVTVKMISERRKASEPCGIPYQILMTDWGHLYNVRHHLFYVATDGLTYPKYSPLIDTWKGIIRAYATWHGMSDADDVLELWSDVVEGFLTNREFDIKVDPVFRAWMYGNLCKFVLIKRQQKQSRQTEQYDPENPGM